MLLLKGAVSWYSLGNNLTVSRTSVYENDD